MPASAQPRVRQKIGRLNALAIAKASEKDFLGAIELLRQVLNLNPDSPAAHGNLGVALWQAERLADAEIHCRRAIALKQDYVPSYMVLASVLQQRRAFSEALACYNRVVSLQPDNAAAHNNAGLVLRRLGDFAQAETAFARAADLLPDDPRVRFNQLMMRRDDASLPQAIECCRRSLEQRPDDASVLTNLAVGLQLSGRFDEAWVNYEKALAINPDQHDARFNLSLLLLLRGDYERGWREYEHRWHLADAAKPTFPQPMWRGEPLEGKTILLQMEQGFGDAIQCFRYVPEVMRRGGRVILRVERALVRVAASLPGDIVIKPGQARLPPFDVWCPLLSLPRVLDTQVDSIPAAVPYLGARAAVTERWRRNLAGMSGLKVGLAWAGNPRHVNDLRRSIEVKRLAPLLDVPGVAWVSLQVGRQGAAFAELAGGRVVDLSAQLTDFAETAGAIANLDLVIAVDTSVVHVAGALARPAWVMLPFSPDWRWLMNRDDSPWYPTLRLYRQPAAGDWDHVIARVAADLSERAAALAGQAGRASAS
ncbi:MAG: tetratricopeptide repeat protein [Acetobacteraceae bacterium]|nr:tetratricopeptide repeat protein [Acetobacteraceae bacterium]